MVNLPKKIMVIAIYLIVLAVLWLVIGYRYGHIVQPFGSAKKLSIYEKNKSKEGLKTDDKSSNYTYGTLLRNIPEVEAVAKKFTSVRPQKFKDPGGYSLEMPNEFNGIEVWKDYLSPITEQGKCGNCWAHAAVNVLADRFAILSLGQVKFIPSPYDVTICGAYHFTDIEKQWGNITELQLMDDYFQGRKVAPNDKLQSAACEGAALYTAANILYTEGVTDIDCFPAKAAPRRDSTYDVNMTSVGNSDNLPYCYKLQTLDFDTCVDQKTAMKKYRAKTAYNVGDPVNDTLDELEKSIQHEIYRNGPLVSGFMVFDDFMDPSQFDGKTIYQHKNKSAGSNGGHAIRIVGWGEETVNGELIPFWWIANSWGTGWGINGYFKMKRKILECDLEKNAMAMLPDFPGMVVTNDDIIPIETEDEIATRNFTKHYLDPTSGYFTSAMTKVEQCKLKANVTPYADPEIKYPDYNSFYAAEIGEYVNANPISTTATPLSPLVTCTTSGVVQPAPAPSTTQQSNVTPSPAPSSGVVQPTPSPAPSSGVVQPTPSPAPTPSSGVVQPTPSPPPSNVQPNLKSTKICLMQPNNKFSTFFDKIASNVYIFNSIFFVLASGGSYLIWKLLDDNITPPVSTLVSTPISTPVSTPTGGHIPALGI